MSAVLDALSERAAREDARAAIEGIHVLLNAVTTLQRVEQLAAYLEQAGVSVLGIAADNSPDWVLADLAAQRAGIPVVPLPPYFTDDQVRHVLADSGVDAIAADEFGSVALMSLRTRFIGELTSQLTLLRLESDACEPTLYPGTAKISYTSGTTGRPRGVCLSQDALDAVALGVCEATRDLSIERHLCLLPMATLLENVAGVYAPLIAGAEVSIPSLAQTGLMSSAEFDARRLLECIDANQAQSVILMPQLLAGLVGAIEQGARLPESLRFAAVGGGVVGLPLLERADQAGIPVFEGYGLTECGSVVALNTPQARRAGSVGRPLPHSAVRIGEGSEVIVAGALMSGYLGDERPPAGEIATGDIGYLDRDGYLFISGRKKDVLITSFGRNVSPEWVEASLTAADSIEQAALFGDGRPWNVAIIVPSGQTEPGAVELAVARANRGLPEYAQVRRWILASEPFVPSTGTATANGRLRRAAIERRYRDEIDACYAESIENYA